MTKAPVLCRSVIAAILATAMLVPACSKDKSGEAPSATKSLLKVVVSLPPVANFVERVAGEHAQVEILVGPGQSAHHYEPTPRQITALAECDVYFRVGLVFEDALLAKMKSLKTDLNIVDLGEGIPLRKLLQNEVAAGGDEGDSAVSGSEPHGDDDHEGHEGHEHHEHAVGAPDPHHWMDPRIVVRQTDLIAQALNRMDPSRASIFTANAGRFQEELSALHRELTGMLAPFHGREFFVYHPAYGYFADAYKLTQVAIEFEGKEPSSQQLTRLIERARKARVRSVFTQPQYSSKGAEVVAEALGAEVVIVDPYPRDYVSELQALGFKLVDTFTIRAGGAESTPVPTGPSQPPAGTSP